VDNVDWTELVAFWGGAATESRPLSDSPLMMTAETATALTLLLGNPDPDSIDIVAAGELMERAWDERPAMAVVPFEDLEPRWKVLHIDGLSVLDRDMDAAAYPLTLRASLSGLQRGTKRLIEVIGAPLKNRDPERMSVVLMTGVTALTRATAVRMERHGPTYPAEDILPWLLEPDVTHISNEVSFAENCPSPSDYRTMVFCSAPDYIELFEYADIDVIELTGNHVLDWGGNAMLGTLDTYDEVGIPYFGGGRDVAEAQRPLTISAGIHTFGFIGCQIPPSSYAHEAQPGAAPCDYDLIRDQIAAFRQQGIIPIVTLQYWEFYQYAPTLQQQKDFRALAEAGAIIVSGSQAHQPQSFDFYGDTFIHYGLGNLFFDQMWSLETRQEFLDRHVFYNGQHISTELLTAILEDYSRPRPMTSEERAELLTAAFEASPW
jgi:poly-gamma-glutamate synthesis protein (capsule biosynthesis protein)